MLDEFFAYLLVVPVQSFIHWNMRDINYGFQAIEHRYKVLGGEPTIVGDNRKFDLARILIALFGVGYAPHGQSGRMHSIMTLNLISERDALTGAEEAKAFDDAEFVKLHQSTLRKVDVIANLLDRVLSGNLKTASNWRERHGIHPAALVEYLTENWVWGLIVVIGVVFGIVVGIRSFL